MKKTKKGRFVQWLNKLSALQRCAADALELSDGEFRVWYGSPFLLWRGPLK